MFKVFEANVVLGGAESGTVAEFGTETCNGVEAGTCTGAAENENDCKVGTESRAGDPPGGEVDSLLLASDDGGRSDALNPPYSEVYPAVVIDVKTGCIKGDGEFEKVDMSFLLTGTEGCGGGGGGGAREELILEALDATCCSGTPDIGGRKDVGEGTGGADSAGACFDINGCGGCTYSNVGNVGDVGVVGEAEILLDCVVLLIDAPLLMAPAWEYSDVKDVKTEGLRNPT